MWVELGIAEGGDVGIRSYGDREMDEFAYVV